MNDPFLKVTPNVFANNRLSALLDTGKDSVTLLKESQLKCACSLLPSN